MYSAQGTVIFDKRMKSVKEDFVGLQNVGGSYSNNCRNCRGYNSFSKNWYINCDCTNNNQVYVNSTLYVNDCTKVNNKPQVWVNDGNLTCN